MSTFANSEDPDAFHQGLHMHLIRAYTFFKAKKIFRQKNTIFTKKYNLTPLDMYNGLSQVYGIKPEVYKQLKLHSLKLLIF